MATQIKPKPAESYEQDFFAWVERQAALLRARRFDDLDLDPLIEEVEASARAELNAVLSDASVVIEHLLKLEHSPATGLQPGWRASVREHRRRLRRGLTPRLRQLLASALPGLYREVRDDTAALLCDYGESAAADALPEVCPYDLERLTGSCLP
jgi:hypothetical protein